jgi:hypothetical protein
MPNLSCPKDGNHKVFVMKDRNGKYFLVNEDGDSIDDKAISYNKRNCICAECGSEAVEDFIVCPLCEDMMENKGKDGTEIWICRQCDMILFGYSDSIDITVLQEVLGEDVG